MTKPRLRVSSAICLLALAACAAGTPSEAPASDHGAPLHPDAVAPRLRTPGLRADFTPGGVTVSPARGAAWTFQATPRSFGCDDALAAVGSALPEVRAGRVEYARPELREWYAESPRGLEQGFTLAASPACRRDGGRGVVIALGGGLGAVVSADGRAARLHHPSTGAVLRYTDLHVIDAAGTELPATLEVQGEALAIRFDDAGARYPVEVDPIFWAVQQELTASDAAAGALFGSAVSLSVDTALVGAPEANGGDGAAYVFIRAGTTWNLAKGLSGGDNTEVAQFGASVSVSAGTALIGAPGQNQGAGILHVFVFSGADWIEQQQIPSPDPASDAAFGKVVVLSADTALVSQGTDSPGPAGVYVFVRSGTTWSVQQQLTDGSSNDRFGAAVALSGDTALVGAPGAATAYVFVRSGTTWTLEQQLVTTNGDPGDGFGTSVALDGDTAVVGAPDLAQQGNVHVFARAGTTWTEQQDVGPGSLGTLVNFGTAVALGGGLLAVAGYDDQTTQGSVTVYAPSGGSLQLQQDLTHTGAQQNDQFGFALALDGTTLLAGAVGQVNDEGAAFVWTLGSAQGDPCTEGSTCLTGLCVDGVCCTVAACPAAGICNAAETCQPGTGACSFTPTHEGMPCDPGPCEAMSTCQSGVCVGDPLSCGAPADDCHEFGTCDPTTGTCTSPAKPDGQPCAGGMCAGGVCVDGGAGTGGTGGDGGGGGLGGGSSGCDCEVRGGDARPDAMALMVGLLLLAVRRRRSPA